MELSLDKAAIRSVSLLDNSGSPLEIFHARSCSGESLFEGLARSGFGGEGVSEPISRLIIGVQARLSPLSRRCLCS